MDDFLLLKVRIAISRFEGRLLIRYGHIFLCCNKALLTFLLFHFNKNGCFCFAF